jgi:uncharacterized protein YvpB
MKLNVEYTNGYRCSVSSAIMVMRYITKKQPDVEKVREFFGDGAPWHDSKEFFENFKSAFPDLEVQYVVSYNTNRMTSLIDQDIPPVAFFQTTNYLKKSYPELKGNFDGGHAAVMTGYDDEFIFLNDPAHPGDTKVKKKIFKEEWEPTGIGMIIKPKGKKLHYKISDIVMCRMKFLKELTRSLFP